MSEKTGKTYGFFHPYCNAGGGGEKVLWQAVQATLDYNPKNKVVIYTGDKESSVDEILRNVVKRFDIDFDKSRVDFKFLKRRALVDPKTWPFLTLLGQAVGSVVLAYEATKLYKPDIWVETMGYPFTYPLVSHRLGVPIIAYVHYPVMSKDMLGKLKISFTSIFGIKQSLKYVYWKAFMWAYSFVGSYVDITLTNSTWTNNHIKSIWKGSKDISVLYPPCSTEKFSDLSPPFMSRWDRKNTIVCIAQFRPEKRHDLIIQEYAKFLKTANLDSAPKLVLIGSIRGKADEIYVENLKSQAEKLNIPNSHIKFILDAKYEVIQEYLLNSSFGLNAMWNEHFGIAVVEYVASGLIPVVHASAGPLLDIVVPWDAEAGDQAAESTIHNRTGFFFKSETDPDYANLEDKSQYPSLAEALVSVSNLTDKEKLDITDRGKICVLNKFSDVRFNQEWDKILYKAEKIKKSPTQSAIPVKSLLLVSLIVGLLSQLFKKKI